MATRIAELLQAVPTVTPVRVATGPGAPSTPAGAGAPAAPASAGTPAPASAPLGAVKPAGSGTPEVTPTPGPVVNRQQVPDLILLTIPGFKRDADNAEKWADDLSSYSMLFLAEDFNTSDTQSITQTVWLGRDRRDALGVMQQIIADRRQRLREVKVQRLTGVGEDAYLVTYATAFRGRPSSVTSTVVIQNNLVIDFRITANDGVIKPEFARDLAQQAVVKVEQVAKTASR